MGDGKESEADEKKMKNASRGPKSRGFHTCKRGRRMEIDSSDSSNLRTILKFPKFPPVYPGPAFRDFCSAGLVRLAAVSAILLILCGLPSF